MSVLRIVLFMLAAMRLRYRFLIFCCPLLPRYPYAFVMALKRVNGLHRMV